MAPLLQGNYREFGKVLACSCVNTFLCHICPRIDGLSRGLFHLQKPPSAFQAARQFTRKTRFTGESISLDLRAKSRLRRLRSETLRCGSQCDKRPKALPLETAAFEKAGETFHFNRCGRAHPPPVFPRPHRCKAPRFVCGMRARRASPSYTRLHVYGLPASRRFPLCFHRSA